MTRALGLSPLTAAAILMALALAGCGSAGGAGNIGSAGASGQPVDTSFSVSDTPPTGVAILRFQIQVTAASLQPSSGNPVSLLTAPATVELEHLQSESALLSNPSVPSGNYTSFSATFANPQMAILNRSNTTYLGCAPNQVCNVTPTLNQTTASDNSAPFPIALSSASPLAFVLHFDVNASVQGDLSISPTISLKEVPPLPNGALEQFHVEGRVTAVNSPSFTLQTGFGSLSLSVATNASTQYDFGSVCAADSFTCLAVGDVVRVGVNGMAGGTLVASEVDLVAPQGMPALEGVVIGVNTTTSPAQIQLALMDFQDDAQGHLAAANMTYGLSLTIKLPTSTTYSIDTDGVTLPTLKPPLSFASIGDIVVGQTLAVQPTVSSIQASAGPSAIQISFTAPSVQLQSSELTATIAAISSPSFTLNGLPPLLTGATPPITEIQVDTQTGTNFENITGVSALADGDTVSVGGLLFNTASTPTLVAERVMQR